MPSVEAMRIVDDTFTNHESWKDQQMWLARTIDTHTAIAVKEATEALQAENQRLQKQVGVCEKGLAAAIIAMNNLGVANTRDDSLWALFSHAVAAQTVILKAKEDTAALAATQQKAGE